MRWCGKWREGGGRRTGNLSSRRSSDLAVLRRFQHTVGSAPGEYCAAETLAVRRQRNVQSLCRTGGKSASASLEWTPGVLSSGLSTAFDHYQWVPHPSGLLIKLPASCPSLIHSTDHAQAPVVIDKARQDRTGQDRPWLKRPEGPKSELISWLVLLYCIIPKALAVRAWLYLPVLYCAVLYSRPLSISANVWKTAEACLHTHVQRLACKAKKAKVADDLDSASKPVHAQPSSALQCQRQRSSAAQAAR